MAYLTDFQYYVNSESSPTEANWGNYQYVSLSDLVNNFVMFYSGENELIHNESRVKILFHMKRCIQELNYDALKEVRALELSVDEQLRFPFPKDYVNFVRVSLLKNGTLFPLQENRQTMSTRAYLQANDGEILFDETNNILLPENSELDADRLGGTLNTEYLSTNSHNTDEPTYPNYNGDYYKYNIGPRYGANTDTANANPVFMVDKQAGCFKFASNMAGEVVVLEYITDGMSDGVDSDIKVNKLFEDYIYAAVRYEILSNRMGVQEYVVNRARRKKMALLRNARIRISNMHPSRLLQAMRGRDKWLK